MKLIIFGATGSIGRHLVDMALDGGHRVTAFTRRPDALGAPAAHGGNLTIAHGDVLDRTAVSAAIGGQDAVLCSLGAGRKGGVRARGTANILSGMADHGVRRLICQTTLGVGDSAANLDFFWKYIMFGLLLRPAFADHVQQEDLVSRSDLDWTIVRPAAFTDGPETGAYSHGFAPSRRDLKLKIARADVARFMLDQIDDQTYLRRAASLSY